MKKFKYIINFKNKTYQHIMCAYLKLKERFRRSVAMKLIAIGAGLYRGYFSVI